MPPFSFGESQVSKSHLVKRSDRLVVQIDRLAVGGKGVARHEGLVIFVSDTAPGDRAEIEITFAKKNFAEAKLLKVLEASSDRREPPCPVAGVCGGCNWQHLTYESQVASKRRLVTESLQKFSGFEIADDFVKPVIESPKQFRYRNRVQLHHAGSRLGFNRRGSHEIVDIADCPITDQRLADLIPQLRRELANAKPGRFEIYLTKDGTTARRNSHTLEDSDGAGPAFSQVNTEQNENLVEFVLGILRTQKDFDHVFDLYAGSGNFTFPLAHFFQTLKITGVELNSEAVKLAREHVQNNFAGREFEFIEASVDDAIRRLKVTSQSLVVLDPPRVGCGPDVLVQIAKMRPKKIVYVSCHPATLARDLKPLFAANYELEFVQPFDMFPQTDHVETVVSLVPRAASHSR